MSLKEFVSEILNTPEEFNAVVAETFPGGVCKVKDIQEKLKVYIEAQESSHSQNMPEDQRKQLRAKYFESNPDKELDEAGYREFLKNLLTELISLL